MLNDLTSTQLSEWEAYDKIDPVGSWREDYRLAYLSSLLTNIAISSNTERGKKPKLTEVSDFMLDWDTKKEKKEQTVEEMRDVLLAIAHNWKKK